jgi:hypothetical protein
MDPPRSLRSLRIRGDEIRRKRRAGDAINMNETGTRVNEGARREKERESRGGETLADDGEEPG